MFIVDKYLEKLEKENKPIRIGLIGAGFAARGFALQVLTGMKGMRIAAISNRTLTNAKLAYTQALGDSIEVLTVENQKDLDEAISKNKYVITENHKLLTDSANIDVIVEATGEVHFAAPLVVRAIKNKKHIVLINAELDGTIGPILKSMADEAGVVYTQIDGDQPGKLINMVREIRGLGFKPVLAGNIKSLIDFRRTPKTQEKWSAEHFQEPKMPTSFADGTKISFEMATVANALGFKVGKRNMYGPRCARVEEAHKLFNLEEMEKNGLVDYILGAEPSFGVFVLATCDNPIRACYMNIYKMGEGPLYTFYIPSHLGPLEGPSSVARAMLFGDATLAPVTMATDVISLAKFDLKKGDRLDGVGGFTVYGAIDNYEVSRKQNLLPIGLSDGAILKRDLLQDAAITYDDVELPASEAVKLRELQDKMYQLNNLSK